MWSLHEYAGLSISILYISFFFFCLSKENEIRDMGELVLPWNFGLQYFIIWTVFYIILKWTILPYLFIILLVYLDAFLHFISFCSTFDSQYAWNMQLAWNSTLLINLINCINMYKFKFIHLMVFLIRTMEYSLHIF